MKNLLSLVRPRFASLENTKEHSIFLDQRQNNSISQEKIRAIGYNQSLALRILNPNIIAFIYAMTILTERAVTW